MVNDAQPGKSTIDPLVPADVDLRSLPFTPIFRARLFGSEFHANVSDTAWRAGVTLWLKSWEQVPAGSLPRDEIALCRLAELGRDLKTWRKVAPDALRHWVEARDGRLYHPVIAGIVNETWNQKAALRDRTRAASKARWKTSSPSQSRDGVRHGVRNGSATESVTERIKESKGKYNLVPRLSKEESQHRARARARANGKDQEYQSLDPVGRSAPLRARGAPLKEQKKELLRQKVMRFVQATQPPADRQAAFLGLMGEDPEHSAQWWLDTLDQQMRAKHWDDTESRENTA
jgi:hypothetical protein